MRVKQVSKATLLTTTATIMLGVVGTAQAFMFPALPGPYNVISSSPTTIALNNAGNSAGVTPGLYGSATITANWAAGGGDPWSNEAVARFNGVSYAGATSGAAGSGAPTSLTFANFSLGGVYDPSVNGTLNLDMGQTFGGSNAFWSNITITLNAFVPPTPPAGAQDLGVLAPGGMLMAQNAYVANTVQWYKFSVTTAIPLTEQFRAHTAGNTLAGGFGPGDTEMAIFDFLGNPILGNDDYNFGGGEYWSNVTQVGLAAGDYYVAVSAFNLNYGPGFTATADDTGAPTGDIKLTILPAPGTAALLGLGGLLATRRRRA